VQETIFAPELETLADSVSVDGQSTANGFIVRLCVKADLAEHIVRVIQEAALIVAHRDSLAHGAQSPVDPRQDRYARDGAHPRCLGGSTGRAFQRLQIGDHIVYLFGAQNESWHLPCSICLMAHVDAFGEGLRQALDVVSLMQCPEGRCWRVRARASPADCMAGCTMDLSEDPSAANISRRVGLSRRPERCRQDCGKADTRG
jgi:hypothetical protein